MLNLEKRLIPNSLKFVLPRMEFFIPFFRFWGSVPEYQFASHPPGMEHGAIMDDPTMSRIWHYYLHPVSCILHLYNFDAWLKFIYLFFNAGSLLTFQYLSRICITIVSVIYNKPHFTFRSRFDYKVEHMVCSRPSLIYYVHECSTWNQIMCIIKLSKLGNM